MSISGMLPKIGKGLIIAVILFMLSCFVTTLIYTSFKSFSRASAVSVLLVSHYLAIFIGGLWSSKAGLTHGWLQGLGVGFIFSTILLIWGATSLGVGINMQMIFRYFIGIMAGTLGGMIGVNLKG